MVQYNGEGSSIDTAMPQNSYAVFTAMQYEADVSSLTTLGVSNTTAGGVLESHLQDLNREGVGLHGSQESHSKSRTTRRPRLDDQRISGLSPSFAEGSIFVPAGFGLNAGGESGEAAGAGPGSLKTLST